MRTHRDILALWPSFAELRRDLIAQGFEIISPMTVVRWHERHSIPAEWWAPVVTAAEGRGFHVSLRELADAASERRRVVRQGVG